MPRTSEAVSDLLKVHELLAEAVTLLASPALQEADPELLWHPVDRVPQSLRATVLQHVHAADGFSVMAAGWLTSEENRRAHH